MKKFRTLFLILSIAALAGCSSEYKSLELAVANPACVAKFLPIKLATSWYTTSIDVTGTHFSGLLLIKNMPDSSRRIVFTNEEGVSFFDFEFDKNQTFHVKSIIKKMDRKPLINVLRKDFELLLGLNLNGKNLTSWTSGGHHYFGAAINSKETSYLVTDADCTTLSRLELGSKRKKKVTIAFDGKGYPLPDGITISHYLFSMSIQLSRFEKE